MTSTRAFRPRARARPPATLFIAALRPPFIISLSHHRLPLAPTRMSTSGEASAANLSEAARSEAMDDDDATQVSGREAQRLAGIARQADPAAAAQRLAAQRLATQAAAAARTGTGMPAEERARRRREHAAEVRAQKKHKKEQTLHEAHTDMCELMNVLLAADGCKTVDEDEMDAFEGWLHEERKQLQAGAEVNLA